jgi:hypothetical protein
MRCAYDERDAAFQCTGCGRPLCGGCAKLMPVEGREVRICPACGELVQPLEEGPRNLSDRSFWYYAATALFWPLSVRGVTMVLIIAVFVTLSSLVSQLLMGSGMLVGRALGLLVMIFVYGYLYLLFLKVIRKTALGDDSPPSTPEMESFEEAFTVFFRILAVLIVWAVPAITAYYVADQQATVVFWILAGVGALFLPMSLLAVGMFETLRGLHPVPLVKAMVRVPLQYIFCCAFFHFVIGLAYVVQDLDSITGIRVLDVLIGDAAFIYALYAAGRLLGGLHAANSVRFGWVRAPRTRAGR